MRASVARSNGTFARPPPKRRWKQNKFQLAARTRPAATPDSAPVAPNGATSATPSTSLVTVSSPSEYEKSSNRCAPCSTPRCTYATSSAASVAPAATTGAVSVKLKKLAMGPRSTSTSTNTTAAAALVHIVTRSPSRRSDALSPCASRPAASRATISCPTFAGAPMTSSADASEVTSP